MSKRTMIVLVFASILVLTNGGIALGKGPESVTITGPGIDSPIELMDAVSWPTSCDESCPADPMVRLMEQSGLWYGTGDLPIALDQPAGELGPRHVLRWVRFGGPGEPAEDRTIRQFIYLYTENGPVIHTPSQESLAAWGSDAAGWFNAPDGLPDTLISLGVQLPEPGAAGSGEGEIADNLGLFAFVVFLLVVVPASVIRRRAPRAVLGLEKTRTRSWSKISKTR